MFIVLSMALRRKPELLVNVFPILKATPEYLGEDKLPVIIWMVSQVTVLLTGM